MLKAGVVVLLLVLYLILELASKREGFSHRL